MGEMDCLNFEDPLYNYIYTGHYGTAIFFKVFLFFFKQFLVHYYYLNTFIKIKYHPIS